VLAIVRLCAPTPVVFCFDQVEALGIAQQPASAALFTRMAASLIDGTNNVLIVSTMLSTFWRDLEECSMRSDFQRIGKEQANLRPLDWELSKALIARRLESIAELATVTPITERSLRAFFDAEHGSCNPRA